MEKKGKKGDGRERRTGWTLINQGRRKSRTGKKLKCMKEKTTTQDLQKLAGATQEEKHGRMGRKSSGI